MKFSRFGEKFSGKSGIVDLMADMGEALHVNPDMISMGGGNPSHIPAVESIYRKRLMELLQDPVKARSMLGIYQSPQGDELLIERLAALLKREYGWPLSARNIAVSNGGQSAFYVLANLLAGRFADDSFRRIQFPLVPEYLGYMDVGLEEKFFVSAKPSIDILDEHVFKYRVNFSELQAREGAAALCVSRPTNPTGNVLTDEEVRQLDEIARRRNIPLIIDGAYGTPFPNIIFSEVNPHWSEHTILLLSLSKLGLPGLRTGFVVANEEIIRAFAAANTILNLACGNVGPAIASRLIQEGEIFAIGKNLIMPFYRDKAMRAMEWFMAALGEVPFYIHRPEGALFLWLWFPGLPIGSEELYERLKKAGVLVISGHNSFAGLGQEWAHTRECIRVSYAQHEEQVKKGIAIIAREVKEVFEAGS